MDSTISLEENHQFQELLDQLENSSSQPSIQWQATETFQSRTDQLGNQNDDIVEIESTPNLVS